MVLVANKVDLVNMRKVSVDHGQDLARRLGVASYIETSAKDPPVNVDAAFLEFSTQYYIVFVLFLYFTIFIFYHRSM